MMAGAALPKPWGKLVELRRPEFIAGFGSLVTGN